MSEQTKQSLKATNPTEESQGIKYQIKKSTTLTEVLCKTNQADGKPSEDMQSVFN